MVWHDGPAWGDTAADPPTEDDISAHATDVEPSTAATSEAAKDDPTLEARRLSLLAAGHMAGRLADVQCRTPVPERGHALHFAHQAGLYRDLVEQGREPIAVNVGDSIFPGAIPRFLLQSASPEPSLAEILVQIPWTVHALGKRDLAIAKRELARFFGQAEEAGLRVHAANVHCRAGAADDAFCRSLAPGPDNPPWTITERGDLRIGLVAITDPAAREYVAAERLELVEMIDPAEILPEIVRDLRVDHNVDLVFVVHHGFADSAFERLYSLVSGIAGIDLAFTNEVPGTGRDDAGADVSPRGFTVATESGTYIVGAETGHDSLVAADLEVRRDSQKTRWHITSFEPMTTRTTEVERDQEAADALGRAIRNMCSTWGQPINRDVPLASPFSREDFQRFVLGIVRSAPRTDVALLNTPSFREPDLFPLSGSLTFADVYTVLAFNNRLAVLEVKGTELTKLAGVLGEGYVAVGLENDDGSVKVNGRSVVDDATYLVATNSFLASGGEGLLDDIEVDSATIYQPTWDEDPPTIAAVVVDYVENMRFSVAADKTRTLHPEENFPDLNNKLRWQFRAAIDGSYNQVSVRNPEAEDGETYGRPQLAVSPTSQINLEVRAGAQADSRYHRWQNELLLQYAIARTETDGQLGSFRENKDVTRLRSQYRYNGFRHALDGSWYAPAPFAELQLETELRVPDDRDRRRLALTGIVGPELQLLEPLTVFAGFNARRDVTQPAGEFGYGLTAGYRLQRFELFETMGNTAELESELELYLNRIDGDREQELRGTSRLFLTIIGELSFTTTLSTFLYRRTSVGDLGFNTSVTVGLNYSWNKLIQTR